MEFKHSTLSRYLSEVTGTFFLVLTAGCNVLGMTSAGAISVGGMLMCMIYALGSVSGAHFNPAVTIAIYLSGRSLISLRDVGGYIASQLTGGILAGMLCEAIFRTPFTLRFGRTFQDNYGRVFVLSAAIAIGTISNCCLNPAVGLGSFIASKMDSESVNLSHYWVYYIAPIIGSLCGVAAFYMVRRKDEYEPKNLGILFVKPSAEDVSPQSLFVERSGSVAQVGLTSSDDEQ